jgi:hypothetical protein
MNSLPEQHIDSLPKNAREDAYWKVSAVCVLRGKGLSEDEVADKLEFSSVEDMYFRLRRWGLPGLVPLTEFKHVREGEAPKAKPKAKAFGEKTPLPPSEGAIPQFRRTLGLLLKQLEKLRGFEEEYLQSKRFGGTSVRDGKKRAWGAVVTPPEPLTTFIAIEALVSRHASSPAITHLVGVLHPAGTVEVREPFRGGTLTTLKPAPGVNIDHLSNQIKKLREHAAHVARLIRGWEDTGRRPPGEVSPREHSVLPLIKQRAGQGVSDEEILEEVNRRLDRGPLAALHPERDDFTLDEIRHLKDLGFEG